MQFATKTAFSHFSELKFQKSRYRHDPNSILKQALYHVYKFINIINSIIILMNIENYSQGQCHSRLHLRVKMTKERSKNCD